MKTTVILFAQDMALADRLETWLSREHHVQRITSLVQGDGLVSEEQKVLVWAVPPSNETAPTDIAMLSQRLTRNDLAGFVITGTQEAAPNWAAALVRRDPRLKLVFPAAPAALLVTIRSVLHDLTYYS